MQRRIKPAHVLKAKAPVNEIVLRDNAVDLTQFPVPKFWPGDGGRYIGTGNITLTKNPDTGRINVGCYRQMLHGPRRVGLYCSPGKHGLIDRDAWWARGEPCEVVAAYGIDPVLFMLAAQVFGSQEVGVRRRGRHDGPRCRADRGGMREPADPRQCRARHRGRAASG